MEYGIGSLLNIRFVTASGATELVQIKVVSRSSKTRITCRDRGYGPGFGGIRTDNSRRYCYGYDTDILAVVG